MSSPQTVDAQSSIDLFASLERAYSTMSRIHVFLDNARYHHARAVQGLAATAREAHRPALRAALVPAPESNRAPVESDARERHPQPAIRQIPRFCRSRAWIPPRNRAAPVRRVLVDHHRQFSRHRPEGLSDPRVTPL